MGNEDFDFSKVPLENLPPEVAKHFEKAPDGKGGYVRKGVGKLEENRWVGDPNADKADPKDYGDAENFVREAKITKSTVDGGPMSGYREEVSKIEYELNGSKVVVEKIWAKNPRWTENNQMRRPQNGEHVDIKVWSASINGKILDSTSQVVRMFIGEVLKKVRLIERDDESAKKVVDQTPDTKIQADFAKAEVSKAEAVAVAESIEFSEKAAEEALMSLRNLGK